MTYSLQKKAFLAGLLAKAGLAHVVQNGVADRALKSDKYSKTLGGGLASSFRDGLSGAGKASAAKIGKAFVGGAVFPEGGIASRYSHSIGESIRQHVGQGGKLGPHDALLLHHAARGNFDKVKRLLPKATVASAALEKAGLPIKHIANLPAHRLVPLGNVFKDTKTHPILKAIHAATDRSELRKGIGGSRLAQKTGNALHHAAVAGAGALTALEPAAGIVNLAKTVTSHKSLSKLPGISHASHFIDNQLKTGVKTSFSAGLKGSPLASFRHLTKKYLVNAPAAHLDRLSNSLGSALRSSK